eukprot:1190482-Prorocentrum_minimum.AAC.1
MYEMRYSGLVTTHPRGWRAGPPPAAKGPPRTARFPPSRTAAAPARGAPATWTSPGGATAPRSPAGL